MDDFSDVNLQENIKKVMKLWNSQSAGLFEYIHTNSQADTDTN